MGTPRPLVTGDGALISPASCSGSQCLARAERVLLPQHLPSLEPAELPCRVDVSTKLAAARDALADSIAARQ